jgi:hypothetical protein
VSTTGGGAVIENSLPKVRVKFRKRPSRAFLKFESYHRHSGARPSALWPMGENPESSYHRAREISIHGGYWIPGRRKVGQARPRDAPE